MGTPNSQGTYNGPRPSGIFSRPNRAFRNMKFLGDL